MEATTPKFTQNFSFKLRDTLENEPFEYDPQTRKMTCVEIGSFEGLGSLIITNLVCAHPDSRLYCIDPWDDVYVKGKDEFSPWDSTFVGQYQRFVTNTKHEPKIIARRGTSTEMIATLDDESIDFSFIDGDHSPEQVYKDGCDLFPKTKAGGYILFDDYLWESGGLRCADGINRFLTEYFSQIELLQTGAQVLVRKLETTVPSSA